MIDKDEWLNTPEPTEDPSPEYIIMGDPDKEHREAAWRIAIGLQDVDHLKPSEYLIEIANKNIDGIITSIEAREMIDEYYEKKKRYSDKNRSKEADLVASRINSMIQSVGNSFSVGSYLATHHNLFKGIYEFAGKFRDYDIWKSEWVLNQETVDYSEFENLEDEVTRCIEQEKDFDFTIIEQEEYVKHMADFVAKLWKIHAFGEGNTRTTAVFFIKRLKSFGFDYINNDMFEKHSWYFRNALVRANYDNPAKGIRATTYYLELFLENLMFGTKHELHNRDIHVNNIEIAKVFDVPSASANELTMFELRVLEQIKKDPEIKQSEIAKKVGRSLRTVKSLTKSLSDKGAIKRENGKRYGYWVVQI